MFRFVGRGILQPRKLNLPSLATAAWMASMVALYCGLLFLGADEMGSNVVDVCTGERLVAAAAHALASLAC